MIGRRTLERTALLAFCALAAGITFVTLCPIEMRPRTGAVGPERAGALLLLAGCLTVAYPKRRVLTFLGSGAIAIALEVAQTFDPGRHGRVQDALEKIGGAAAGVLLASAFVMVLDWLYAAPAKPKSPEG